MGARHFSRTCGEARQRFLEAAHKAAASIESFVHPLKGAEGEELPTDPAPNASMRTARCSPV